MILRIRLKPCALRITQVYKHCVRYEITRHLSGIVTDLDGQIGGNEF